MPVEPTAATTRRGTLVTFEGIDGCGKSTQAELVARVLEDAGVPLVRLREPGGTAISEGIRAVLLDPSNAEMCDECELLLYEASRAQLVRQVIEPTLAADMTASEAATKKSQELGCACRPDTVTRDVLDHLQSADVQMALAELDRKMGVVPVEAVDQSDIFVEPKRRRRRGGSQEGQGTGVPTATTSTDETDGSATPSRRRRHKSRGARGAQGEGAVAEPQATEQADPATRAEEAPRRRRHHRAADTDGGAHEVTDQDTQPAAKRTVKRTRHPGDRGGAVSRQQPGGQQSRNQASQAQQQGEGEAKPKRRRHRGSRGGGNAGGSEAGGGAPSAE